MNYNTIYYDSITGKEFYYLKCLYTINLTTNLRGSETVFVAGIECIGFISFSKHNLCIHFLTREDGSFYGYFVLHLVIFWHTATVIDMYGLRACSKGWSDNGYPLLWYINYRNLKLTFQILVIYISLDFQNYHQVYCKGVPKIYLLHL